MRVPASGVVEISGVQQVWVAKNYGGLTVSLWIDLSSIHVILADQVTMDITLSGGRRSGFG